MEIKKEKQYWGLFDKLYGLDIKIDEMKLSNHISPFDAGFIKLKTDINWTGTTGIQARKSKYLMGISGTFCSICGSEELTTMLMGTYNNNCNF